MSLAQGYADGLTMSEEMGFCAEASMVQGEVHGRGSRASETSGRGDG